jgi:hypothetical protein
MKKEVLSVAIVAIALLGMVAEKHTQPHEPDAAVTYSSSTNDTSNITTTTTAQPT